ncbi:hypothetical protein ZIOFF_058064 [Zingiber officinale]|uniref:NADP-dependent oxidoreductase domain-containing protein n=1 Tax=Zingiber officinale TaxID=94328 RepID=A0A8J5FAE7_ZINOF|nr:hypothetical protein ZIOFF_058064 [Zingiber officinale]
MDGVCSPVRYPLRSSSTSLAMAVYMSAATAATATATATTRSLSLIQCGASSSASLLSIRKNSAIRCVSTAAEGEKTGGRVATVKNGGDELVICRVLNGMWQTSGGWGPIDRDDAVEAMLRYADAGLSTFDMSDHYGPAEDLYGIFINRVRRNVRRNFLRRLEIVQWILCLHIFCQKDRLRLTKWVPPPVKITSSYVRENINISRKRMDVSCLDMLQFHWWDYSNPGYLDALKHLTDLKEEGRIKFLYASFTFFLSLLATRYGTVMGGLLSEKFLDTNVSIPFAGPPLNTPSLQKYKRMVDAWGGWSLFQTLLRTLKKVASKHGVSIPTVAVRYILNQPSVAGSMIGVRLGLSEHIHDTNAILSLVLDEEDMNSISEVSSNGRDLLKVIGDCGDEYQRI